MSVNIEHNQGIYQSPKKPINVTLFRTHFIQMLDKQCSLRCVTDPVVRMWSLMQSTLQRPDLKDSLSDSRGWLIFREIEGWQGGGLVAGFWFWLITTYMQGYDCDVLGFKTKLHIFFYFFLNSPPISFFSHFFIPGKKETHTDANTRKLHIVITTGFSRLLLFCPFQGVYIRNSE